MPEFKGENPGERRESRDTSGMFFTLMGDVIKKFGSLELVAAAVDKDSDVAAAVVVRWFKTGVAPQTPSICKRIVGSLGHLAVADPKQVGHGTKKLVPPMGIKPEPKPSPEDGPEKE